MLAKINGTVYNKNIVYKIYMYYSKVNEIDNNKESW